MDIGISNNYAKLCLLKWTTESEIENLGYILEKRYDGSDWEVIASYKSHPGLTGQGTTSSYTDYEFIDYAVADGVTYEYRLADVDYSGNVTYNATRTVTMIVPDNPISKDKQFGLLTVFPNPFNSMINIHYDLLKSAQVKAVIYDINGNLVAKLLDEQQDSGWHNVSWNGTDKFGNEVPGGVYISKISSGKESETFKIMYLK